MPHISSRGINMPSSPIRKLVPFADEAKERGITVYQLNIGQPDIETPSGYFDAIQKADIKVLAYSHSGGIPSFRNKCAEYYQRNGIDVSSDELIVTTGASEAIRFGFLSCLNPGDEVIIPEPFYANYNGFAIDAGITVVPLNTRIEENFDLPEIEEFEKLITLKTRAIMICNPGNPTGKLYSLKALERLRDIVRRHDLYLFADEVYREFCYDGQQHFSTLNLEGIEENVIMFDSISKRFSACGARIGSIVSRNVDVINTAMKFAQARLSPPTLGQIGGEAVMDLPASYYEEVVGQYCKRRDALVTALKKMEGVVVPEASGAFYLMVQLPIDDCDKFCRWMLEKFDYKGSTVMMAPGSGFYGTRGQGKQEVRIAYVLNEEDLLKAMECLKAGLEAYPGRKIPKAQAQAAS